MVEITVKQQTTKEEAREAILEILNRFKSLLLEINDKPKAVKGSKLDRLATLMAENNFIYAMARITTPDFENLDSEGHKQLLLKCGLLSEKYSLGVRVPSDVEVLGEKFSYASSWIIVKDDNGNIIKIINNDGNNITFVNIKGEIIDTKTYSGSFTEFFGTSIGITKSDANQLFIKAKYSWISGKGIKGGYTAFDLNGNEVDATLNANVCRINPYTNNFNKILNYQEEVSDSKLDLIVPAKGHITSEFGTRDILSAKNGKTTLPNHGGIDITNIEGTPIYSAGTGIVLDKPKSDIESPYGNYLIIDNNGRGWKSYLLYAHLKEASSLKIGDSVKQGDIIGLMGETGNSTGPHLHFEIRIDNKKKNPRDYINFGDKK